MKINVYFENISRSDLPAIAMPLKPTPSVRKTTARYRSSVKARAKKKTASAP